MRPALALLTLALLAGCSSPGGDATPAAAPPPAAAVLGDPATVDWCALLDPAPLTAHGSPSPATADGYDACHTSVSGPVSMILRVGAQDLEYPGSLAVGTRRADDGTSVITQYEDSVECSKLLELPGGARVLVRVEVRGEPLATGTACAVADAELTSLRTTLMSGTPVAHVRADPGSARTADPCAAVPADLAAAPGLAGTTPRRGPLSHHCTWEATPGTGEGPWMFVTLSWETRDSGQFREHRTIEGQEVSGILSDLGRGPCVLILPLRPVAGGADGDVETVEVKYLPPTAGTDPCVVAAKVAAGVKKAVVA
ncbi:hypothetical protein L6E12_14500 [Actinokineospora sp. PR83]|uniref:hypothetical protein n=1 Tax=Actinokineospora sp. PR83 TaxID=2884908 RepID=UPI001F1C9A36|nr:hypothetical protein [Actinokineospora sp. PR83]MCG8917000.1 hypothetical protein [Actinokineospora sp. PR83]